MNWIDVDGRTKWDKLFGLPKKFWKWYHRAVKRPGDKDLSKDEAKELFDEWKAEGMPGPDNKGKAPSVDDSGFGDLFDWLFPFPSVPSCLFSPAGCMCPSEA
jgi:hypothetical protein